MKSKCEYNHEVCNNIDTQGGAQGGAALIILIEGDLILLPFDKWRKMYAICAGKRNKEETCYIETIKRESLEEIKFDISNDDEMDGHFIEPTTELKIRFIVINKTPIFIGKYKREEINLEIFNQKIEKDNNNCELSKDFKEVLHLKIFKLSSIKKYEDKYTIEDEEGQECRIHGFTYSVLDSVNKIF